MAGTANRGSIGPMIVPSRHQDGAAQSPAAGMLALLREHLDAALAHCEAIEASHVTLGASVASGANGRGILRQHKALAAFVADLRARELSIALRLTRACVVAEQVVAVSSAARSIARLVKSGATVLTDAGARLAAEQYDGQDFNYLASRGLLPAGATCLPDDIAGHDQFTVLGVMPLADVQAFLGGALDTLDALGPA